MENLGDKLERMCHEGNPVTTDFDLILNQMSELYRKKNHDYGDSFTNSCNEFGLTSPIIRISDKLNRLKTLTKTSPIIGDEKVEDTLLDLANYAVMTLVWLKNQ